MHNEQSITDFIEDRHPGETGGSISFETAILRTNSLIADRIGNSGDQDSDIAI